MHCYAVNKKVLVHCAVYIVTYPQEKIYLLTVLYALLRILKKNLLVHYAVYTVSILKKIKNTKQNKNVLTHCAVCIVMHTQEKKNERKRLLHCTVYIVMHSQEKRVGSLCCMHCYGSGSRQGVIPTNVDPNRFP